MPATTPLKQNSITSKSLNVARFGGASVSASSTGGATAGAGASVLAQYGITAAQNIVIPAGEYPLTQLDFPQIIKESADVSLAPFRYLTNIMRDVEVIVYLEMAENADIARHVLHIRRKNTYTSDAAYTFDTVLDGLVRAVSLSASIRLFPDDELSIALSAKNLTSASETLSITSGQVKILAV